MTLSPDAWMTGAARAATTVPTTDAGPETITVVGSTVVLPVPKPSGIVPGSTVTGTSRETRSSTWTVTRSGDHATTVMRSSMDRTITGSETGPEPGSTFETSTSAVNVELIAGTPDGEM